jgi:hypothetical protein
MELKELTKNYVLGNSIRLSIVLWFTPEVALGNLDSYLKTLEKANYVKIKKSLQIDRDDC